MSDNSDTSPPPVDAKLTLLVERPGATIAPALYGHFAEHLGRCIYDGIWVGEASSIPNTRGIRDDVVTALKNLRIPVLRWPGGCFADEYHWKDGIGPRAQRPKTINTHWGGVVESNHFGTHEFMDLCERTGAAPYVCGNVGSGSVQEMREWVEYMTSDADSATANLRRRNGREAPWHLPYFGVGNESWGCGGNMRPEYYADVYRRYATFVKNYSKNQVRRIACGPNGSDYRWTEIMMKLAGPHMYGLSLHWYTLPTGDWGKKGSASEFGEAEWCSTLVRALRMEELIMDHAAIVDRYDPERRVGLVVDEWGTWYDADPDTNPAFLQQANTLRDALVAALTLDVFNRHCDRVVMANIAQTVNVLQAVLLTEGERLVLTPSYHVFEMYKVHQGATLIPLKIEGPSYACGAASLPMLHASASRDAAGRIHVSIVNVDPHRSAVVALSPCSGVHAGRVLTAARMNARNTCDDQNAVSPVPFQALAARGSSTSLTLPPKSVVVVAVNGRVQNSNWAGNQRESAGT
jgi:alpha-N-arabinofuranosidase